MSSGVNRRLIKPDSLHFEINPANPSSGVEPRFGLDVAISAIRPPLRSPVRRRRQASNQITNLIKRHFGPTRSVL